MGTSLYSNSSSTVKNEIISLKNSYLSELSNADSSTSKIRKKAIINLVNHIHFIEGHIHVHLRNNFTCNEFLAKAYPEPCVSDEIICRWNKNEFFDLKNNTIVHLVIDDGNGLVLVPVENFLEYNEYFSAALPNKGYVWNKRQGRRYTCQDMDIDVEIIQDYNKTVGTLKNFSSIGLCIKLDIDSFSSLNWMDTDADFLIQLFKGEVIFSGYSRYVKRVIDEHVKLVVFAPFESYEKRRKRENRNHRLYLLPTPMVMFNHPFLNKTIQYEIVDISIAGFSVQINIDESTLMPGMIIRDLTILVANNIQFKCSVHVVYQLNKNENEILYGFTILDMELKKYNQLFAIIINAHSPNINMTNNINLDSLWEFFFRTGFIYPKKYELIDENINEIKETYRKLYHKGHDLFTNITFQRNGGIYGHCSIVRAYEHTWLAHHLAAQSIGMRRPGIKVLDHMINYIDGQFHLNSSNMDYLLFCYRPDNRIPNYFFGEICKDVNNPKYISIDRFAYISYSSSTQYELYEGMKLEELNISDFEEFNKFYEEQSGGLLLDVLNIGKNLYGKETISDEYRKIGLMRISNTYSLKDEYGLKAVFVVDQSDIGINMSDLLNCIKVFVVDTNLSWTILSQAINLLGKIYNRDKYPVLIYLSEYVDVNRINYDKSYCFFAYDLDYWDEYIKYLLAKLRE